MNSGGGLEFLTSSFFLSRIWFVCSKYRTVLLLFSVITCVMPFTKFATTIPSWDYVLMICQYMYLQVLCRNICSYLNPACLHILLNLIIVIIIVTSGVLKPANREENPCFPEDDRLKKDAAREYAVKSRKCSEYDCNIGESIISELPDARKEDSSEHDIRKSNASHSGSRKLESAICTGLPDSPRPQDSITIQGTAVFCGYKENTSISDFHQGTVIHTDAQVVQINDDDKLGGHLDIQLLQIKEGEGEMSSEELNAKAEEFLLNSYRRMRQESTRLRITESRSFQYMIE